MKAFLTIAAVALSSVAAAEEMRFQCPDRYLTKIVELAEKPLGWRDTVATVRPELSLSGGGVVGGPPKLYPPAELHGNTITSQGGRAETRYPVGPEGESWAFCAYGRGGEIQLYRRVDGQGRRECIVKSSQPKPPDALKVEVVCR